MQLMAGIAVEEIQVVIEILYDLSKKHRSQTSVWCFFI